MSGTTYPECRATVTCQATGDVSNLGANWVEAHYNDQTLTVTATQPFEFEFGRVIGATLALQAMRFSTCSDACGGSEDCKGLELKCSVAATGGAPEWDGRFSSVHWKAMGYDDSESGAVDSDWWKDAFDDSSEVWRTPPCAHATGDGVWAANGKEHALFRFTPMDSTTCAFTEGKGVAESERRLNGTASSEHECEQRVKTEFPEANGASVEVGTGARGCSAEFGMSSIHNGQTSQDTWRTCKFTPMDKLLPTLTSVTIESSNPVDQSRAKIGEWITITVEAQEVLLADRVNMIVMYDLASSGCTARAASVATVNGDFTHWTGSYKLQEADMSCSGSIASFRITFADRAGHPGATTTTTTDSSSVELDFVNPSSTVTVSRPARIYWPDFASDSDTVQHISHAGQDSFILTVQPDEAILQPVLIVEVASGHRGYEHSGARLAGISGCQAYPPSSFVLPSQRVYHHQPNLCTEEQRAECLAQSREPCLQHTRESEGSPICGDCLAGYHGTPCIENSCIARTDWATPGCDVDRMDATTISGLGIIRPAPTHQTCLITCPVNGSAFQVETHEPCSAHIKAACRAANKDECSPGNYACGSCSSGFVAASGNVAAVNGHDCTEIGSFVQQDTWNNNGYRLRCTSLDGRAFGLEKNCPTSTLDQCKADCTNAVSGCNAINWAGTGLLMTAQYECCFQYCPDGIANADVLEYVTDVHATGWESYTAQGLVIPAASAVAGSGRRRLWTADSSIIAWETSVSGHAWTATFDPLTLLSNAQMCNGEELKFTIAYYDLAGNPGTQREGMLGFSPDETTPLITSVILRSDHNHSVYAENGAYTTTGFGQQCEAGTSIETKAQCIIAARELGLDWTVDTHNGEAYCHIGHANDGSSKVFFTSLSNSGAPFDETLADVQAVCMQPRQGLQQTVLLIVPTSSS